MRITASFAILFFLIPSVYAGSVVQTPDYFELILKGCLAEALELTSRQGMEAKDSLFAEFILFRIDELASYGRFAGALEVCDRLENVPVFMNTPHLHKRLLFIKQRLLLHAGRRTEAEHLKQQLNFLCFTAIGPFSKESTMPVSEIKDGAQGKTYPVYRFNARRCRDGSVTLNSLLPKADVADSVFYFESDFYAERSGRYEFYIGKTGACMFNIDGTEVFHNDDSHGFCHGQYYVAVYLPAGDHRICIKLASSDSGIKFSCAADAVSMYDEGSRIFGISRGYFPALEALDEKSDEISVLMKGYLFFRSGLNPDEASLTQKYCSLINGKSSLYPSAQYFIALSLDSDEAADMYLQRSVRAMKGNAAALFASVMISIRNGFLLKAWDTIRLLREEDVIGEYYLAALAEFYLAKGWTFEAEKTAQRLSETDRSSYLYYSAAADAKNDMWHSAAEKLNELFIADTEDGYVFGKLREALEKCGRLEEALSLCQKVLVYRPADIDLMLLIADYSDKLFGSQKALPWVASALKHSPYNSKVLEAAGDLYHKLDRDRPAAFYYREALRRNSGSYRLRQKLNLIENNKDVFANAVWKGDINKLEKEGERYKDHGAVYLLNERLFRINPDASYEERVRIIVKIYEDSAAREFGNQHIIYEPGIDAVENSRCVIINGDEITEITEKYTTQLSDPESRLYYNLNALTVPVTGLSKGSILDFTYTVKNRGGSEYRNSFSEHIHIGEDVPVVLYNVFLSYPEETPIHVFSKNINESEITAGKESGRKSYRLAFKHLPAYKSEIAMPPLSDILPSVCFTSFKSWEELAGWYRLLLKDRIVVSNEMKEAVKGLLSPEDTDREKIRKIYSHVTDSIRYVGFEFGLGAIQPRSCDKTYASRMGDCKDIALVLTAFLREAGLNASIALVATRDKRTVDLQIPSIGQFNHAICYTDAEGGIFLDGTASRTSWLELSSMERDIYAFVIDEKSWKFIKTESPLYFQNRDEVVTEISLKGDSALMERALRKQGDSAVRARYELDDLSKKQKSLTEYWNGLFPGAQISDMEILDADRDSLVRYRYKALLPGFASRIGDEIVLPLFPVKSSIYGAYAVSKSRTFPILVRSLWTSEETVRIHIPEGYELEGILRKNKSISHRLFDVSYDYSYENGMITLRYRLALKGYSVPVDDYEAFRCMARSVQEEESSLIVLKPVSLKASEAE